MTTYDEGDGAPAGKYAVLISLYPAETESDEEAEQDLLNERYSDPNRPRWKKTVKAGDNDPKEFVFVVQ